MSADMGLPKLVDLLNTTRRQAELSINTLSQRVQELSALLAEKEMEVAKVTAERDLYKSSSIQLKQENSQKWRLQERDDWKSLVDSIQKDRARLQDENLALQTALEASQAAGERLEAEVGALRAALGERRADLGLCENNNDSNKNNNHDNINDENASINDSNINKTGGGFIDDDSTEHSLSNHTMRNSQPMTPIKIKSISIPLNGNSSDTFPAHTDVHKTIAGTPHTVARQLKLELERASTLLEEQRRAAEAERQSQTMLIGRLQSELARYNRTRRPAAELVDVSPTAPPTAVSGVAAPSSSYWSFPVYNMLISPFISDSRPNIGSAKAAIFHV